MGATDVLEGGFGIASCELGQRVQGSKTNGQLGFGVPRPGSDHVDRRDRSSVASGPQVPDGGVSNQRDSKTPAVDRPRPEGEDITAVLSLFGKGADDAAGVHLQRHVVGLPESHR